MRLVQSTIGILLLAFLGLACATAEKEPRNPASDVLPGRVSSTFAWLAIGPGGERIARLIQPGEPCPEASWGDGQNHKLEVIVRSHASASFSEVVCEARQIPAGAKQVNFGRFQLKTLVSEPRRILILGDTGCRLKAGDKPRYQECNSTSEWPFGQIAQKAADWGPDLVIHVGDYHYREAPCPPGNMGCDGAAIGDVSESWLQDFFTPAQALLAKAPWIFVRGNHEICKRAGNGWFRYLDPRPMQEFCKGKGEKEVDGTPPYLIPFAEHVFAVVDAADDKNIQSSLDSLGPELPASPPTWLLQHRPILTPGGDTERTTAPAQLPQSMLGKVAALIVGHKHTFSYFRSPDTLPPEMITGNGGDTLETFASCKEDCPSKDVPNYEFPDFGFLTVERDAAGEWRMIEHDRAGNPVEDCKVTEKAGVQTEVQCGPAGH